MGELARIESGGEWADEEKPFSLSAFQNSLRHAVTEVGGEELLRQIDELDPRYVDDVKHLERVRRRAMKRHSVAIAIYAVERERQFVEMGEFFLRMDHAKLQRYAADAWELAQRRRQPELQELASGLLRAIDETFGLRGA